MPDVKFETRFREELEFLYDAERQIIDAFPQMIAAAFSEDLAAALQEELDETKGQVGRLERIFQAMGEEPGVNECQGMKGLILECENLMSRLEKSPVRDVGIIGTAQKVKNYEMCGYEAVRALAELLGQQEAADTLEQTLQEERAADDNLSGIAESILAGHSKA